MKYVVIFMLIYIPVFLIDFLIIKGRKLRKKTKNKKIDEIDFITRKHKIDMSKFNIRKVSLVLCLINAFIISFVGTIVTSINIAYYYQLLIAFVLVFSLIYSLYEIYGRILKSKEIKKSN